MSILERIRAHGGDVIRDGWHVRIRRGRLPAAAIDWLREHREALLDEVWPDRYDFEERAAIREYDGGQPRAEAEAEAWREIEGRRPCS